MVPTGSETKKYCAGEDQQQLTEPGPNTDFYETEFY
jgi:hypothetical protein